jgi:hypothetical protein
MMVKQVYLGFYHTTICTGDGLVCTLLVMDTMSSSLGHGDREQKTREDDSSASSNLGGQIHHTGAMS